MLKNEKISLKREKKLNKLKSELSEIKYEVRALKKCTKRNLKCQLKNYYYFKKTVNLKLLKIKKQALSFFTQKLYRKF